MLMELLSDVEQEVHQHPSLVGLLLRVFERVHLHQVVVPRLELWVVWFNERRFEGRMPFRGVARQELLPHVHGVSTQQWPFKHVGPRESVTSDGAQEFDYERRDADGLSQRQAGVNPASLTLLAAHSANCNPKDFIGPKPFPGVIRIMTLVSENSCTAARIFLGNW